MGRKSSNERAKETGSPYCMHVTVRRPWGGRAKAMAMQEWSRELTLDVGVVELDDAGAPMEAELTLVGDDDD